jgi:hypothetical protein
MSPPLSLINHNHKEIVTSVLDKHFKDVIQGIRCLLNDISDFQLVVLVNIHFDLSQKYNEKLLAETSEPLIPFLDGNY